MRNAIYALVLAGGSGERFWPLSRRARPKQLLRLASKRTLLEDTLADKLENNYDGRFEIPQVVEMSGARIPADALAKVQRRFGLLDRGPGLVRQGGLKKPARRKSV